MTYTTARWILPALALAFAAPCAPPPPPAFSPTPPAPEAAATVAAYLDLLAKGEFEPALAFHDLRGMRQYLLDRRLAELKSANPQLSAKDLDDISARLQIGELAPARLRQILLEILTEAGYPGMTWQIRGYAPAPDNRPGFLVSIMARDAQDREKPILLGLLPLGDDWRISSALIEQLMGQAPVVRLGKDSPPPPEVDALLHDFWSRFQAGELNEAHALLNDNCRQRLPLLLFLEQAQKLIDAIGAPVSWEITQGIQPKPDLLVLGVVVQGTRAAQPTLMGFALLNGTWTIDHLQLEKPEMPDRPAPPRPPAAVLSPPDLRPRLDPAPPVAIAPTVAPAPTTP